MYAHVGLFVVLVGAVSSLPMPQDFVVLEADLDSSSGDLQADGGDRRDGGRLLVDNSPPGKAGFRAPLPGSVDEELGAVIVEVDSFDDGPENHDGFEDIPRDTSGPNQAGFRLPLPEIDTSSRSAHKSGDIAGFRLPISAASGDDAVVFESDRANPRAAAPQDFVIVEAASAAEETGRNIKDIPRDRSGLKVAGFRLPLPGKTLVAAPATAAAAAAGPDFVVLEADDSQDDINADTKSRGSNHDDIPRDRSGLKVAGFRLPLPDHEVVGDVDDANIPTNNAGLKVAAFRLPLSEQGAGEDRSRVPRGDVTYETAESIEDQDISHLISVW